MVEAVDSGATIFETAVRDMQTDLVVNGQYIEGTLHKLTDGAIAGWWGEGYFMALNFDDIPEDATVMVGFIPSMGSGFATLDEDHNGVFKVTDKNSQIFKVITKKGDERIEDTYYLGSLVFED